MKKGGFAIINLDDEYAQKFISIIPEGVKVITYGVKKEADVMAKNVGVFT